MSRGRVASINGWWQGSQDSSDGRAVDSSQILADIHRFKPPSGRFLFIRSNRLQLTRQNWFTWCTSVAISSNRLNFIVWTDKSVVAQDQVEMNLKSHKSTWDIACVMEGCGYGICHFSIFEITSQLGCLKVKLVMQRSQVRALPLQLKLSKVGFCQ